MATCKIILYRSKFLKDGTHPVVLQVVDKSKAYKISLGYRATPDIWDDHRGRYRITRRNKDSFKTKNKVLKEKEELAEKVLDTIRLQNKPFSPTLFKSLFIGDKQTITLFEFFDKMIADHKVKGKIGTANTYRDAKNALRRFAKGNTTLRVSDVDYKFLKRFETHLFARGCSGGGISVYMRSLRATINEAIRQGLMNRDLYPFNTTFNKNGYSIAHLKSKASPRALSIEDMEKFKNFPAHKHPELNQAHKLFLFSYYTWGMNFKDMAMLTKDNIYNGRIRYIREKTGKHITIGISENIQTILDEFRKEESEYIFPLLNDLHKSPEQIKNRVKKCLKKYNKDLNLIGDILGIDARITSYVARHTFATTLKKHNAAISKISEALGHADVNVTKVYLKRFEDAELDELDELL